MVWAQIQTVISRILANEVQFLDTIRNKSPGLSYDVGLCAAAMRSTHPRDRAETAGMITPFSNLQVDKMFWRQPKARRCIIRNKLGPRVNRRDGVGKGAAI